ncbi:hypothetical protein Neosp_014165 [[Neocosmospora] mangrovei]
MRATQKTAEAGTRSAVAGESSALSGRKSAAAAEESARAATKSAQAAENGVAVMQKQLEVMIQDKRGPPPATNTAVGQGLLRRQGRMQRYLENGKQHEAFRQRRFLLPELCWPLPQWMLRKSGYQQEDPQNRWIQSKL